MKSRRATRRPSKRPWVIAVIAAVVAITIPAVILTRPDHSSPSAPKATGPGPSTARVHTGPSCPSSTVTSWVGNSFGGADDSWVQPAMQGLWVASDGTVYGEAVWNEGARELRGYRKGEVFGKYTFQHANDIPNGGTSLTGDDKYVYAPVRFGNTAGVMRYDRQLNPAPFTGGTDPQGALLVVSHTYEYLTGIAVSGNRLYVGDPQTFVDQNSAVPSEKTVIRVYDTTKLGTGQIASFSVPRARAMTSDGAGNLWVLQQASATDPAVISSYSPDGTPTGKVIKAVTNPTALAVDTHGGGPGQLLVTDDGPDQNVKIFSNLESTPKLSSQFGVTGGVNAGPQSGTVGPLRFNGPAGVGADADGNIYVANNGSPSFAVSGFGQGTSLEAYKPNGTLLWQQYGQKYNTAAGIDPQTGSDVYTAFDHYQLDFSKPTGQQWTRVGWTLDRAKYPYDPRINDQRQGQLPSNPIVRTLAGKTFLFMGNGLGDAINIFRFAPSSQTAIPSGSLNNYQAKASPGPGEFIWRDVNGDGNPNDNVAAEYDRPAGAANSEVTGWWIDSAGNVWQTTRKGIREIPFDGLDDKGNPIYRYAQMRTFPVPAPFTDLRRLAYDPKTDQLVLSGYTQDHPTPSWLQGDYKFAGSTLAVYENFTKATTPTAKWTAVVPYTQTSSDAAHKPITLTVAGDYAFVGYFTGDNNQLNSDIHVYRLRDGAPVDTIVPGPEIGGRTGNTDMEDGTVAYQSSSGAYVILNEEDLYNKTVMYLWCPS